MLKRRRERRKLYLIYKQPFFFYVGVRYSGEYRWSGILFKLARCGYTLRVTLQASYRVYKKKLNRYIQFLIYTVSLGTYNVE